MIRAEKASIMLMLDHFWIKQFHFNIEDPSAESLPALIQAQAADHASIAEELLICQIIDTIEHEKHAQGELLYLNKAELAKLKRSFQDNKIIIEKIFRQDFPQAFFYNRQKELAKRSKYLKKIFSVSLGLFMIILFSSVWSISVNNKVESSANIDVQYLKAVKENSRLKIQKTYQAKNKLIRNQKHKQLLLLKKFFKAFPGSIPRGIKPEHIIFELDQKNIFIKGIGSNIPQSNLFAEKLTELSSIKYAFIKKAENTGKAVLFELEINL